jgi:WD40 repeat protein
MKLNLALLAALVRSVIRHSSFVILPLLALLAAAPPAFAQAPVAFANTGSLVTARWLHTATLLPNGQVLVAGGQDSNANVLASAELYDPASGTWTATGSLATARFNHTATLLPNGKVLVAGGYDTTYNPLASAELYDPASGTWTATGSLATARYFTRRRCCPTARCSSPGGQDSNYQFSRARSSTIRPAGRGRRPAASPRHATQHTATLLPNGKVLVAGGSDSNGNISASAELYDPAHREMDGDRQPRHGTLQSHGDAAAQRPGARRRGS